MDNGEFRRDSSGVGGPGAEGTRLVRGQVRSDTGKSFCSIQYVDEEGEQVIRHAFLTEEEQKIVVDEFAKRGISGKVYDLTPPDF